MNEDPVPEPVQQVRTVTSPFWYEDMKTGLKRSRLKERFKIILLLTFVFVGIYFMFQWFGGWFLLGFVTVPAWYFWALRQIDKECYTLIEVRLEGDKLSDTQFSQDTQINMYSIPPDIWRNLKKIGTPFTPGNRVYICDHFDEDNEKINFAHDSRFTNLNFWTRLGIWMKLKGMLPELEKQVALSEYNKESLAMERAIEILSDVGAFTRSSQVEIVNIVKPKIIRMKKEADYIGR